MQRSRLVKYPLATNIILIQRQSFESRTSITATSLLCVSVRGKGRDFSHTPESTSCALQPASELFMGYTSGALNIPTTASSTSLLTPLYGDSHTDSQNFRAGRDLMRSLGPAPLLGAGKTAGVK
uniref:Uncharacterized protein n=1 Tax=Crocodylus porosus TaxID=8502 RepID=A0A7M4E9V1_CROPO